MKRLLCRLGFHRFERKDLVDLTGRSFPELLVCKRCGHKEIEANRISDLW